MAKNTPNRSFYIRRRRQLIPIFLKPFMVLFVLFGLMGIYGISRNVMGLESNTSIYGLESFTFFSALGVFLKSILFFKAIVSVGLWMEKDWAVKLGIIDAAFGIIVCIVVMVVLPFVDVKDGIDQLNIRFEIFLLIPYLILLLKIRKQWDVLPAGKQDFNANTYENEIPKPVVAEKTIEKTENKIEVETNSEIEAAKDNGEIMDKEDPRRFMPK